MNLEQKLELLKSHGIALERAPEYGERAYCAFSDGGEQVDIVYAASVEEAAEVLIKFFNLKP